MDDDRFFKWMFLFFFGLLVVSFLTGVNRRTEEGNRIKLCLSTGRTVVLEDRALKECK